MKKIFFVMLLVFAAGCTFNINPKYVEYKNPVNEKINRLKFEAACKFLLKLPIYIANAETKQPEKVGEVDVPATFAFSATGHAEIEHVKSEEAFKPPEPPPAKNFRTLQALLDLLSDGWSFVWSLFWDLIALAFVIALLTEYFARLCGTIPLLKFVAIPFGALPKMIQSIIFGAAVAVPYKYLFKADFLYAFILCAFAVAVANIGWEYLVNKACVKIAPQVTPKIERLVKFFKKKET